MIYLARPSDQLLTAIATATYADPSPQPRDVSFGDDRETMPEATPELMYEILKKLPDAQTRIIEEPLADHAHQLLRLREDVNNLRSDDLRRETSRCKSTWASTGSKPG